MSRSQIVKAPFAASVTTPQSEAGEKSGAKPCLRHEPAHFPVRLPSPDRPMVFRPGGKAHGRAGTSLAPYSLRKPRPGDRAHGQRQNPDRLSLGLEPALHRSNRSRNHEGPLRLPPQGLNNDVRRNLLVPLAELQELFAQAGRLAPEIRVLTRSGDTSQTDRRRMVRQPPEILITTRKA